MLPQAVLPTFQRSLLPPLGEVTIQLLLSTLKSPFHLQDDTGDLRNVWSSAYVYTVQSATNRITISMNYRESLKSSTVTNGSISFPSKEWDVLFVVHVEKQNGWRGLSVCPVAFTVKAMGLVGGGLFKCSGGCESFLEVTECNGHYTWF